MDSSTADTGRMTSIAIGTDGLPLVSYWDASNGDLRALHCGNLLCNSGNISATLDSNGVVGQETSLTIGADGLPVISYRDDTNADLKVLHCGDLLCSSGNISTTVDSAGNVGSYSSITIGSDELPVIGYLDSTNTALKVLHCGNLLCNSSNVITTLDGPGLVGWYLGITIGADGLPLISYRDNANTDLKVAHCSNAFCVPYFRRR